MFATVAIGGCTPGSAPSPPDGELPARPPSDVRVDRDLESCAEERGAAAAAELVARCVQVSPATHPPCNAANPCSLIKDEIERARVLFALE
ncbi:MAG: hypothetical protein KC468_38025 [Myxococcales bacterium]|nr:hypothetical protein [Myxococcales bacterium]